MSYATLTAGTVVADPPQVAQVLGARSVLLRLAVGTQEAGFLTSFCPIAELPTVVVIKWVNIDSLGLFGTSRVN